MSIRFKELIVICFLLAFILFVNNRDSYSDVSIGTIEASVSETAGLSGMESLGKLQLKKDFGINENDYDGVIYYGHQSVMECEKTLVIKLTDESQGKDLINTIEKKRASDMELFKSYAPDQYKLLSDSVLIQKGNYLIYVVSDNARAVEKAFNDCITG